jgi:hypothetical protein
MSASKKSSSVLSVILFGIGVVMGLVFSAFLIWANVEASLFDPDLRGDAALDLHCPLVLNADETGTVSATFTNTATWDVNLIVQADISETYLSLFRHEKVILKLASGESQEVRWTVSAADKVYGRFVFVKAANNRQMPIPGRVGTCGIVIANIPFLTGAEMVVIAIGLTVILFAAGMALWYRGNRPLLGKGNDVMRSMTWLAVVVGVTVLCGIFGAWLPGIVAFVISILLIAEVIRHYVETS